MAASQADFKDVDTHPKPALESERYHKAGTMSGNSIHITNSLPPQHTLAPNMSESYPARIPGPVSNVYRPAFHPTPVQGHLYHGGNTWRPHPHGVIELGDPHTAQEALLKQVRDIVASKAPINFKDSPHSLMPPHKPFPNAAILEEMRSREKGIVAVDRKPVVVPSHNNAVPAPPRALAPEIRMGTDDLLSDENIEKMEKSYSDEEGKKPDSDYTALESQEEMENLSQGQNSADEDDDHDSFASFLEHETNQSIKEKPFPSSLVSSARNTPTSVAAAPERSSISVSKMKQVFDVSNYAHLTQPAPPEVVRKVKTSSKRAPLDLTEANFPKKSKYTRPTGMVSRIQPPKGTNQTLHMTRLILQPSFNKELFSLVSDYLEIFYQAAGNITNNGNHDKIDQSKVQELVTGMLSEACRTLHGDHQEPKLPKLYLISETDGYTPMSRQKLMREKESRPLPQRQNRTHRTLNEKVTSGRQIPDTVNWKPESVTEASKFVLGVRANEAYGYSGYRGKIYYVHPNLFRYNTDNEDRKYLLEHRKLTLQGGRAFLVLYDQIVSIVKSNQFYSENETVVQEVRMLEDQAFTLPKFILKKVTELMKDQIVQYGGRKPSRAPAPAMNRLLDVANHVTEESSQDDLESSHNDRFMDDLPSGEEESLPDQEALVGPSNAIPISSQRQRT